MAVNYSPTIALGGFDGSVTPRFQMVPKGRARWLNVGNLGGRTPTIADTTIAAVEFRARGTGGQIGIRGLKAGTTFLDWNPPEGIVGPPGDTLEICVKEERRIETAFHYVKDNAGHGTRRSIADLDELIAGANLILDTQANVRIRRKSAATVTVAQDLGNVVRFVGATLRAAPHNVAAAEHEWDDVTAHADAAADFNVFFVWEYEQDATPGTDNTNAGTLAGEKNCLLEDSTGHSSRTLAHETVHLLGTDHVTTAGNLMGPTHWRSRTLTRSQIRTINRSGN